MSNDGTPIRYDSYQRTNSTGRKSILDNKNRSAWENMGFNRDAQGNALIVTAPNVQVTNTTTMGEEVKPFRPFKKPLVPPEK